MTITDSLFPPDTLTVSSDSVAARQLFLLESRHHGGTFVREVIIALDHEGAAKLAEALIPFLRSVKP